MREKLAPKAAGIGTVRSPERLFGATGPTMDPTSARLEGPRRRGPRRSRGAPGARRDEARCRPRSPTSRGGARAGRREAVHLARLGDPVAPAASSEREPLGRVHHARRDRRRDERSPGPARSRFPPSRGQSPRRLPVDQLLDSLPGQRREAKVTELGKDRSSQGALVASKRRGLVSLSRAGPNHARSRALKPCSAASLRRTLDGRLTPPRSQVDLRGLAPAPGLAKRSEGSADRLSLLSSPCLGLVGGATRAWLPGARIAASRMSPGNSSGYLIGAGVS